MHRVVFRQMWMSAGSPIACTRKRCSPHAPKPETPTAGWASRRGRTACCARAWSARRGRSATWRRASRSRRNPARRRPGREGTRSPRTTRPSCSASWTPRGSSWRTASRRSAPLPVWQWAQAMPDPAGTKGPALPCEQDTLPGGFVGVHTGVPKLCPLCLPGHWVLAFPHAPWGMFLLSGEVAAAALVLTPTVTCHGACDGGKGTVMYCETLPDEPAPDSCAWFGAS